MAPTNSRRWRTPRKTDPVLPVRERPEPARLAMEPARITLDELAVDVDHLVGELLGAQQRLRASWIPRRRARRT